ncbi:MAG: glycosylase [Isosphaeraceae bacterium]
MLFYGLVIVLMQHASLFAQELAPVPRFLAEWKPLVGKNPVFQGSAGENWDAKIRERGWVVRTADEWRLYYTGYNVSKTSKTDLRRLGLAVSKDGINWKRAAGQPLVDEHWIEDLAIVQHNGLWIIVAEGRDDIAHSFISRDGLKWDREGPLDIHLTSGEPISAGPRGTPYLMFEKSEWWLFYERGDAGVWLAKSSDRKVWKNVSDEPVIPLGPGAYDKGGIALNQVLKIDGVYYAVLHANQTRPFNGYWTTTLAKSTDLVRWEKISQNPIVANNSSSGQIISLGEGRWRLYTMHPEVRVFESEENHQK